MPQGTLPGHPGMSVQRSNRHLISGATNRKSDRFGFVNLLSFARDPTYHTSMALITSKILNVLVAGFNVLDADLCLHPISSGLPPAPDVGGTPGERLSLAKSGCSAVSPRTSAVGQKADLRGAMPALPPISSASPSGADLLGDAPVRLQLTPSRH